MIIGVVVPGDNKVFEKEQGKAVENCQELNEISRLWRLSKVEWVPLVGDAVGCV